MWEACYHLCERALDCVRRPCPQDRIGYMEQTPAVPLTTHGRMLLLMGLLFTFDAMFLYHAVSFSLLRGPSVLLLFAFEYLILASTVCSTFSTLATSIDVADSARTSWLHSSGDGGAQAPTTKN